MDLSKCAIRKEVSPFLSLESYLNRLYNSLSIDTMVSQIVRLVRVTPSPLVCNNCILALCNAVEINAESIETILNGNFVNSVLDLDFVSSLFFSFSLSEREGFTNAEDSLTVYLLLSHHNRADGASIPALPRASSALVVDSLCLERHFSKSGLHSQDLLLDRLRIQRSRRDRSTIVSGLLSRC